MRCAELLLLLVTTTAAASAPTACATTPDARDALAPCAQARLARQFPTTPLFKGCYVVDGGPVALQNVGVVVLSDVALDVLDDEAPKYALATTAPLFPASPSLKGTTPVSTSWEQLSTTQARLNWFNGIRGVEACVDGSAAKGFSGNVLVVDDVAPYAHAGGPLHLTPVPCPQ